jgi:PAS domain S-box-containing protein
MKTVVSIYFAVNVLITLILFPFWLHNRKRFEGIGLWLIDYIFQTIGIILVFIGGATGNPLATTLGGSFINAGTLILFIGLERFTGNKVPQVHNYILLAVFFIIQFYYSFIEPNLTVRTINIFSMTMILTLQMFYLLAFKVDKHLRPITRSTGFVFLAIFMVSFLRIIDSIMINQGNVFFKSGPITTLLLIATLMLVILLTFTLIRMINKMLIRQALDDTKERERLIADLRSRIDVSKLLEERESLARKILECLDQPESTKDTIGEILQLVKKRTGIEAVAIRLHEDDDYPYYKTSGFPDHFVQMENHLCARDEAGKILRDSQGSPVLECMCGNILRGRTDPKFPFFSEGGSFWSNCTTDLLASTSEEDRQAHTRNRCNGEGYESVALIPLRVGNEIIGLLQLNDHRKDQFTLAMIRFFEGMSTSIGIVLLRKRVVAALTEAEVRYHAIFDTCTDGIVVADIETLKFIHANSAFCRMFGYSIDELKTMSVPDLHPKDDLPYVIAKFEGQTRGENLSTDIPCRRKDGTVFYADVVGTVTEINARTCNIGFFRDTTGRKWAEEVLRESEERYRIQFDQALDAMFIADAGTGIILDCNMAAVKLTGRQKSELVGQHQKILHPPEELGGKYSKSFEQHLFGETAVEAKVIIKSGEVRDVIIKAGAFDLKGKKVMQAIFRDITEQKHAEIILRESEDRFKKIATAAKDAIIMLDNHGMISFWNPAAEEIFGFLEEKAHGKDFHELFAPVRYHEAMAKGFAEFEKTGMGPVVDKTVDVIGLRSNGTEFPVELSISSVMINDEWNAIGIVRDVTERKRAEEQIKNVLIEKELLLRELQISKESFSSIVEKDSTGILVTYKDGTICFVNPAARRLFNRENDELVGEQFGVPVTVSDISMELDIVRKGGKRGVGELQTIDTEWDGKSAYLILINDVTERKVYEESLIKTSEEHKRLDDLKSEFISIASHELRTPLTSIKNAVDIMVKGKAGAITNDQEKFLSMAQRNIDRLSALINDMLDISKIESGKMEYQYIQMDIRKITGHVINTLQSLANKKSIKLNLNISPNLPVIYGDVSKIEEVLINLVGNSIKFTPDKGAVTINVHQKEAPADMPEEAAGCVEISVADTGVGIPEEHRKHLFEKFYQASNSLARQDQGGTGLGLAISKGIIEGHKGKIWYESAEGYGSTFHFTLPVIDVEKQLFMALENELSKAKQKHLPLSVLILKIRDFESIKKVFYGEKDNDKIMKMVKENIISGGIKTTDKIAVSLPNNEIMLIMPETDSAGVQVVQKRIMRQYIGEAIVVSAATYPEDGDSAEELVTFARGGGNLENPSTNKLGGIEPWIKRGCSS